jgi:TolB protein
MRTAPLIAVLALLTAALLPTAAGAFPGRNGKLAYGWSTLDEPELGPFSYSDGMRLIKAGGGAAYVLARCVRSPGQADAGDCAASGYSAPSWAPDGTRIAFDGGPRLGLLDADGGGLRLLPAHGADDGEPAFSLSGTRLAFTTGPAPGANGLPPRDSRELWVSDVYGRDARRLLAAPASAPSWSPQGTIAFERRGQVWTMRADGTRPRRLTGKGGLQPAFSPHGTKLAFLRRGTVMVMNASGGGLKALRSLRDTTRVRWSPDGRRLVVEQLEAGISIANTDGGGIRMIVADAAGATYNHATRGVDWQPLR